MTRILCLRSKILNLYCFHIAIMTRPREAGTHDGSDGHHHDKSSRTDINQAKQSWSINCQGASITFTNTRNVSELHTRTGASINTSETGYILLRSPFSNNKEPRSSVPHITNWSHELTPAKNQWPRIQSDLALQLGIATHTSTTRSTNHG